MRQQKTRIVNRPRTNFGRDFKVTALEMSRLVFTSLMHGKDPFSLVTQSFLGRRYE